LNWRIDLGCRPEAEVLADLAVEGLECRRPLLARADEVIE
jgi:hypothetical protein